MTTHGREDDEAREGVVLPSNGEPWVPGRGDAPPAGQPWGQPWGPQGQPGQPAPAAPPAPQAYPRPPAPQGYPQQPQPPSYPQPPHTPAPPPGAVPGAADETQVLPPVPPAGPVAPAPSAARPGAAPAPGGDDDATRLLRPVSRSAGPPPERDTESTTVLRRPLPPEGAAAKPAGPAPAVPGAVPPPPYGARRSAPDGRAPHAEFEGLFRAGGAQPGPQPADATQQLPPVGVPGPPPPAYGGGRGPGGPGGPEPYGHPASGRDPGGRRGIPRLAVAGIVLVGCTVVGLAAGAAMSGGDDPAPKPQAKASAPAGEGAQTPPPSPSPTADPAEAQAKALDELLADSNDSRSAVIRSVEDIKRCRNLGKAAADLRDAARQRTGLVTRLSGLEIDRLPDHRKLADALTRAWKASASADNHYAAWADQAAGEKGCRKGRAKVTGSTAAGNRASGTATAAKKEAAGLWNPTARRYGLPERQYSQL